MEKRLSYKKSQGGNGWKEGTGRGRRLRQSRKGRRFINEGRRKRSGKRLAR